MCGNIIQTIGVITGLIGLFCCIAFAIGIIGQILLTYENIGLRRQLYPDLQTPDFWWNYSEPMPGKVVTCFGLITTVLVAFFLWLGPPEFTQIYKDLITATTTTVINFLWSICPYVLLALMPLIVVAYGIMVIFKIGPCSPRYHGGPLDLQEFNRRFVAANEALRKGNTDGLKEGICLLMDALEVSGDYTTDVIPALRFLRCALSHHDRADTKGPWNRDLSGYGLFSWKNDLYDRDEALRRAWPHIKKINESLREEGLGWNY